MKKGFACFALAVLFLSVFSVAFAAETRVFDQAELLSSAQEKEIAERIGQFQETTKMDFVVVTSDEAHEGASAQQIADAFYMRGGFGLDDELSGILYYIDMDDRYHYLSTTGMMIDYMTDERIEEAIEGNRSYLSSGRYAEACLNMIAMVERDVRAGIPEGQFRYDVVTGQILTARHKALTTGEILVCALIAAAVGLIFALAVTSKYKLRGSTYDYSYQENSTLKMTDTEDTYLRTTTTQTRRAESRPNNGGGGFGGGGGFSGGSGTHSSGGTSHGGGGGHF